MSDFAERFVTPLIQGGAVHLGLPLSDGDYLAETSGALPAPAAATIARRGQAIWRDCPEPDAGLLAVFALTHDLLVGLHPTSGRFKPGDRYLVQLSERLIERDDPLPHNAKWLVHRQVILDAALQLARHDTFVEFHFLGTVKGHGEAPDYVRFPWRNESGRWTETVTATSVLDSQLMYALAHIAPLTHAQLCMDAGRPLLTGPLEAAFHEAALARWLVRTLMASGNGVVALLRTLGETAWPDPAQLRRWLGLALYLHASATHTDLDWLALMAALAPHAATLGSPPVDVRVRPMAWHRTLIRSAHLEAQ